MFVQYFAQGGLEAFVSKVQRIKTSKIRLSEEVEQILSRIDRSKHVVGTIVVSNEGHTIRSSLDSTQTVQVGVNLQVPIIILGKIEAVINSLISHWEFL